MVKWVFSILQNTWKYSVYADNRKLDIKFNLNTTFVSLQPNPPALVFGWVEYLNTTFVSLQHNTPTPPTLTLIFKYNFCFSSTKSRYWF